MLSESWMVTMVSIFTKIIEGEIPSTKLYEDNKCIVILDINPMNKGHALVIPKEEHETTMECPDDILKHLMAIANKVAKKQIEELGSEGYNILINNKPASGQEIPHVHVHVVPRYSSDGYSYANGFGNVKYEEGEIQKYGEKLRI